MRIAVVSDIHGNQAAFEAVLADLRVTSPDVVLHGGDLADGASHPSAIVDRIRELGWPGVVGNADEMLTKPDTLEEFARRQPVPLQPLFSRVREMAAATREALGEERLAWVAALPHMHNLDSLALVHASPESPWRSPSAMAGDAELESVYRPLGRPIAVYGHIHCPFVRIMPGMTVANSGSVGLPYDGDRRAAYVLLDDFVPTIRRVEYNVDREIRALASSKRPHADWVARMLETARFHMP